MNDTHISSLDPYGIDLSGLRSCGYLRRSREDREAEEEGELKTLEKHKDILTWTAEDYNATISHWYQEVTSGATIDDREQMLIMMRDLADGRWDAVFVKEASRLGRGSGIDQDKILNVVKHSRILVVTPGKIYHYASKSDMKLLRKELQDSSQELDVSIERLQDGLNRGVKRGCYYGVEPYGWKKERIRRNWTLVPHPVNHERMALMYDLVDEHDYTVGQIKQLFESKGWPTPTGNSHWSKNSIRTIIYNPVNKGIVARGKHKTVEVMDRDTFLTKKTRVILSDGEFLQAEGIHLGEWTIPADKWDRVVTKLKNSAYSPVGLPLKNTLSGILRCGKCNYAMIRRANTGRMENGMPSPRFEHYSDAAKGCHCKGAPVSEVMDILVSTLQALWGDQELLLSDKGKQREREKRKRHVAMLNDQLNAEREKRSRIQQGFEAGLYTVEESVRKLEENEKKVAEIEAEIASELSEIPSESEIRAKMVTIEEIIATIKNDELSAKEKNMMLKELIERIDYYNYGEYKRRKNEIVLDIKLRS